MNKTLITQITDGIEHLIDIEGSSISNKIIIYPYGDVGIQVSSIMKNVYSIEPAYLIDNHKCNYSDNIHEINFLESINTKEYFMFLSSTNPEIYSELKENAKKYFSEDRIIELESMQNLKKPFKFEWKTEVGRYSYGPICCDHPFIKSIGSFCSFANGVDYVSNHELKYLTVHPIISAGKNFEGYDYPFEIYKGDPYYLPGVEPKGEFVEKQGRATIGNDVWFGKNVTVTNSANIGNGVVAAAGAVITKDVPDYAIVAGVPAKIIRFRYNPDQIEALNKIAWWDWTDDEIRERFDDFYIPIEDFIKKYI